MTKFDKINSEAIYELHYQEDMRAKGIPYQVSNLVIYTAISALEKQIPKKVSVLEMPSETIYSCPNCHTVFPNEHSAISHGKYCSNCGQALDFNSNGSDTE